MKKGRLYLHETLRAEPMEHQEAVLLVGPELKADIEAVRTLDVAGQPNEGPLVLEGHWHREVVDGTALDHAISNIVVLVKP